MSDITSELEALGLLLGVLQNTSKDPNNPVYTLNWPWFVGPAAATLLNIRCNPQYIAGFLDPGEPVTAFDLATGSEPNLFPGVSWQPLPEPANTGLVWNTPGSSDNLTLGFGARPTGDLLLETSIVQVDPANNLSLLKEDFSVGLRVAGLLSSAVLHGALNGTSKLALTATDNSGRQLPSLALDSPALSWPGLTFFLLRAWIEQQASKAGSATVLKQAKALFDTFSNPDLTGWITVALSAVPAQSAQAFLKNLASLLAPNAPNVSLLQGSTASDWYFELPSAQAPVSGSYPPPPGTAGAFIGLRTTSGGGRSLILDLYPAQSGQTQSITLAALQGSVVSGVAFTGSWTGLDAAINAAIGSLPTGTKYITGSWHLPLLSDPNLSLELVLTQNAPPKLGLTSGSSGTFPQLTLPPASPADLLATLIDWLFPPPGSATGTFLSKAIHGAITPRDVLNLVLVLADGATLDLGNAPFGLVLADKSAVVHLSPKLTIGPKDLDVLSVGSTVANADLVLYDPDGKLKLLQHLDFTFNDIRLNFSTFTGDTGFISSLVPDLKKITGVMVRVQWDQTWSPKYKISGSATIPIQLTLGPLNVNSLALDIQGTKFKLGIDLNFKLGPIDISTYQLGLEWPFTSGKLALPALQGLGLDLDVPEVKLSGMFCAVKGGTDYIGGAVVSVADLFQLSAIGGYTSNGGHASLFIFASLVAPLGGTPWLFITGIAGGFGYNRALPPVTLMAEHPFIQVMSGELSIDTKDKSGALTKLAKYFAVQDGENWVAAGIQFTSFGFIHGKLLLAASFGHDFSFNLLGQASFGISPVAYFELDLAATVDEEKFLLIAGLSPSSYVISRDLLRLRGQFALGVWHTGDHKGDFVLSIGGYHPAFNPPDYYPKLDRVGCTATILGFVHASVDTFFALTPHAIMAGASLSLSAEWAGIGAGLDVYVDVLIQWDPFFLAADLGVTVWFEFFGRHEIGVELEIHTPSLGGTAKIHLFIVSFTIGFGDPPDPHNSISLSAFAKKHLGITNAKASKANGDGLALGAFATATDPGIFRFDITGGRTAQQQDNTPAQEGLDKNKPIPVSAEFEFVMRTRIPFTEESEIIGDPLPAPTIAGSVDVPLCGELNLASALNVTIQDVTIPDVIIHRVIDKFPAAQFGPDQLPAVQPGQDVRSVVSSLDPSNATVWATNGIRCTFTIQKYTPDPPQITTNLEYSEPDYTFPIPLDPPPHQTVTTAGSGVSKLVPVRVQKKAVITAAQSYQAAILRRAARPVRLNASSGVPQRPSTMGAVRSLTVAKSPVPPIAPPASPARRSELFGVSLRVLPARTPVKPPAPKLRRAMAPHSGLAFPAVEVKPAAAGGATQAWSLAEGAALYASTGAGRIASAALKLQGQQTVRVISLGAGGDILGDVYAAAGQSPALPVRTGRLLLLGEGLHPPVAGGAVVENLGIERHSTAIAASREVFAAHGCLFQTIARLRTAANPMDAVPGERLLLGTPQFRVRFPAPPKGASLVLTVVPAGSDAGSAAEQVYWLATNATLSGLTSVVAPDKTALIMGVEASGNWNVEINLSPQWRAIGVVMTTAGPSQVAARLQAQTNWDLVDDRLQKSPTELKTAVTLEVKR